MATGTFSLYLANGTTPVPIPKPIYADWQTIKRGKFPTGVPRVSVYRKVIWRFPKLTATQYNTIVAARLSGRQVFETWKRPEGAVAGAFVMATGIMDETIPGIHTQHDEYTGVTVTFTMVLQS